MLDTHSLKCPTNLKFDYDWKRVNRIYQRILEKKSQGNYKPSYEKSYDSMVYSLKTHGAVISSTSLTNYEWNIWTGALLEFVLPKEIQKLSKKMSESNLNFINFGYFIHQGEIKKHRDGVDDLRGAEGHCNINYVISSTDPNAKTYLHNTTTGVYEEYPSTVGTAWILDSSVDHWVKNSGTREIFQIKVFSPFKKVKQFFIDNNLI